MSKQKKESSGEDSTAIVANKGADVKVLIPLVDMVTGLVAVREEIKLKEEKFKAKMAPLEEKRKDLQTGIIQVLKDRQEFSARFESATATLAVRKTAQVLDEALVIKQLKEKGLTDYISEALNELFEEPKKLMASGKEKLMAGMAIKETEYLSIKTSEADERRKVTTQDYKELQK